MEEVVEGELASWPMADGHPTSYNRTNKSAIIQP